jgi:hypothetical protein
VQASIAPERSGVQIGSDNFDMSSPPLTAGVTRINRLCGFSRIENTNNLGKTACFEVLSGLGN